MLQSLDKRRKINNKVLSLKLLADSLLVSVSLNIFPIYALFGSVYSRRDQTVARELQSRPFSAVSAARGCYLIYVDFWLIIRP
jgi:hypothetical protein